MSAAEPWDDDLPTLPPILRESPAWMDRALCAQTDPEAFFPKKGGSIREAKKICRMCEVSVECLDHALTTREEHGLWGGVTARDRRRLQPPTGATP